MRKAAKRLRYTTEAFAAVAGKPAARLLAALKPVQEILGDHQDTVVLRAVLRQIAAEATDADPFTLGVLYGPEMARGETRQQQLSGAWAGLCHRKVTGWLG